MIFGFDCGLTDTSFDSPAGYSTTFDNPDPFAMGWSGYWLPGGDPSIDGHPVIKYNDPFFPPEAQPGADGNGTFSFYTHVEPAPYDTYTNALVGKAGTIPNTYGDLTGWAPPCTVPEPATVLLLGLGGLALLRKRRA